MTTPGDKLFHQGHRNIIAKQVRRTLEAESSELERGAVMMFALNMAERLLIDDPNFELRKFLIDCGIDLNKLLETMPDSIRSNFDEWLIK